MAEKETSRGMSTDDVLRELSDDPAFTAAWELEVPKVALAVNVARLRHGRGLTQAQLAESAGTRQPRIAEIERGDANPKFETLIRIARALGVAVEDLVRSSEPPVRPLEKAPGSRPASPPPPPVAA